MKRGERWVVDTNVPIVANGRPIEQETQRPSAACRLAAVDFLDNLLAKGHVLLDEAGEIQAEYLRHMCPRGQPGVGDRFLQEVLNSHPHRVSRLHLPRGADGEFQHLPRQLAASGFDPADRKFAALAVAGTAQIANATDSDWVNHAATLARGGINVKNLCGCDITRWFEERV